VIRLNLRASEKQMQFQPGKRNCKERYNFLNYSLFAVLNTTNACAVYIAGRVFASLTARNLVKIVLSARIFLWLRGKDAVA
jgi:hypothetical protein